MKTTVIPTTTVAPIVAIDFGKDKSVVCVSDPAPAGVPQGVGTGRPVAYMHAHSG